MRVRPRFNGTENSTDFLAVLNILRNLPGGVVAAAGGESPHEADVWKDVAQDRGAALTSRIDEPQTEEDFAANRAWRSESVWAIGTRSHNLAPSDFSATPVEAMQSRSWLRR